jgi:hypothetical protein
MDDDTFPNFGNAYTGASPSNTNSASWNPALRPDTESIESATSEPSGGDDDDFFDRYQEPTPRKKRIGPTTENDGDEDAALGSPLQSQRISVEEEVHVTNSRAEPEDIGMQPESTADVEAPISHNDHPVDEERAPAFHDEDDAVFGPDETVEEQALGLEEHLPEITSEAPEAYAEPALDVEQVDQAALEEEFHRPEEHYDYQGEVTEMEKAIDESAEAPLMADEQPLPESGLLSRAPTFEPLQNGFEDDVDGKVEQTTLENAAPHPPTIERSFTTNFTELPQKSRQESTTEHTQVVDQDWPAAGDDKTFGDLLDGQQTSEQELSQTEALPTVLAAEPPVQHHHSEPEWPANDDDAFGEILDDASIPDESHVLSNGALDEDGLPIGSARQDDWSTSIDNTSFDALLGDQAQHAVEETPSFDAEDNLENTKNAADEHWPDTDADADDTFGELLGNQTKESRAAEGLAIENIDVPPRSNTHPVEEDLAAAFAAALDDDDILGDDELDPATLFGDDDDGLLEDDDFLGGSMDDSQMFSQPSSLAGTSYTPSTVQHSFQQPTISTPGTPFMEQNMSRSGGTPSTGLFDVHNHSSTAQDSQRPPISSTQSFVGKAKGGYQSPYDLPMEVVKPRRRPQATPRESSSQFPTPPPRSSSFHQPTAPPNSNTAPPMPNAINTPVAPPVSASATPPVSSTTTPKTDSGFFADLPMKPKLRARPSGTYTPQPANAPTPPLPPQTQFQQAPAARASPMQPPPRPTGPPTPAQQPIVPAGLTQPGKTPLFPEQSAAPTSTQQQSVPNAAGSGRYSPSPTVNSAQTAPTRYSPAPASNAQVPPVTSRYSPAPAPVAQAQAQTQPLPVQRYSSAPQASGPPAFGRSPQNQPFAPRTSSPLAMHGRPLRTQQDPHDQVQDVPFTPTSPPTVNGLLSPERRGSTGAKYTPPSTSASNDPAFALAHPGPPQRSRTQSPGAVMKTARTAAAAFDRPAPAGHVVSPLASSQPNAPVQQATTSTQQNQRLGHRRQPTMLRDLPFAVPQDERAQDTLERWKGHPIFKWSASGTVVHSFPKQSTFFAPGHGIPSVKCTPGMITMEDATTFMPMKERDTKFPGPLPARSKGKKKELLLWMTGKIEDLERETEGVLLDFNQPSEVQKGSEEKLVLWKIMKIYVEHDGALEGTPQIEEEVRKVLLPKLDQMSQVADLQSPASATAQPDPVDTSVLVQLRQVLFEGQRERAVWIAEEKKLWGHALLLASTMGPDMWKQIVSSFVRSQVRTSGADGRSLAALYQVFAGSAEDCVDELVPPSARAGFLMMSKTDGSRAGNPLEGLDQWRETLALVSSNRTPTDTQSLVALGKLLASYGRCEAAHICCLFARQLAKHSGADDTEASFVLLGANHAKGDANLDSIILTEIYEYAYSLSAPSSVASYIPHLQAYKLMHGQQLAAFGLKQKAESYCNHIDSAIRSTTKPSGYYNQSLAQELISFSAFLSQTPQTAGSGGKFFTRPAMDKVSSGVGSWFTKFVAGDEGESDPNNPAPGQGADGSPFGAVNTNQSTISRNNSSTELYNPMMAGNGLQPAFQPALAPVSAPAAALGRYAPGAASVPPQPIPSGNKYAPSVPSQFAPSRSSMDSDRSYEPQIPSGFGMAHSDTSRPSSSRYNSYTPQSHMQSPQMLNVPRPEPERAASDQHAPYNSNGSRRGSAMSQVSNQSYEPRPMFADQDGFDYGSPRIPEEEPSAAFNPEGGASNGDNMPESAAKPQGFEAETGDSYAPPSSGYEPPAYQPYEPEPEPEEEEVPKRRKPMMDDDDEDDIIARAAALKSQGSSNKSDADRQADAAFRAAAEADAARGQDDKNDKDKKGWFGGWFGGKKEQMPGAGPGPGPIRAKLGEQNSFYFDKDLNKWVNKKGGADAATPAASTPPPPRGPPSRVASAAAPGLPAMGPPSRAASSAGSRPPTSSGGPPLPPSGPPSRVGTPASVGSAPPGVLNGPGGAGLMPPPRPSSSLSHASSLDDLLGGPPGGKKGTVKGKKKGGRYVDVMAGK